jgi:hypothetical protein
LPSEAKSALISINFLTFQSGGWRIETEGKSCQVISTFCKTREEILGILHPTTMNATRYYTVFTLRVVSVRLDLPHGIAALWLALLMFLPRASAAADAVAANPSAIPLDQIGATAEKQYRGEGLGVRPAPEGALLRCVFQKLEGQVTREGLWLASTAEESKGERFRVLATAVGREAGEDCSSESARGLAHSKTLREFTASATGRQLLDCASPLALWDDGVGTLSCTGAVEMAGSVARYIRSGLTEEYRVSVDGVQQDFIIAQRPGGDGQLRVDLDVAGARAEPLANGAQLVLEGSGRKLNYHRLRVTDATGMELPARMEVVRDGESQRDSIAHEPKTCVTLLKAELPGFGQDREISTSSPKALTSLCLGPLVRKLKFLDHSFVPVRTEKSDPKSVTHVLSSCLAQPRHLR